MRIMPSRAARPIGLPALPPIVQFLIRLAGVAVVDAVAVWLATGIWADGNWFLALAIALSAIVVTIINLVPQLWPLRWMSPALALLGLLTIYPLIYTFYVAFTNYSDGHMTTKDITVERLTTEKQYRYLPEGAANYYWYLFQNEQGDYAVWLVQDSDNTTYFAETDTPLQAITLEEDAPLCESYSDEGVPVAVGDYQCMKKGDVFKIMADETKVADLYATQFANGSIGITSRYNAGNYQTKWKYDEDQDILTDLETNTPYYADNERGSFIAKDANGKVLRDPVTGRELTAPLGYWTLVGTKNFREVFTSALLEGPLLQVFLWTVGFAFLGVLTSFSMGLLMALLLEGFPAARVIRSLLIIPYAIPGMIGILIWRGMLQSQFGVIPETLRDVFDWAPPFLRDPGWAKFSILLVNLWFAYPYFMLITSGALQSIPSSIYEAAEVDGASAWNKFWKLTLPLLLISVGPLLIASFVFNFNNYLLIEALNDGGPDMKEGYAPPVGHTDNLMTYTYNWAFSSAGGSRNYGLASAIAVLIFIIVGVLTIFQFRLTKRWEEVGENV